MAGGQERILRRRIKSVQSTKKITRAMELIAASRIVRAQQRVAAARPYSEHITNVLGNLASAGAGLSSPLLTPREDVRAAGREVALITVGKKAEGYFRFRGQPIEAGFQGMTDQPSYEDARTVAAAVTSAFEEGRFDQVELVYTQFISVGTQRVVRRRFMPLDPSSLEAAAEGGVTADYEFEPAPGTILERLLPRYAEARLFAAMLDASASEHAARQRAMKSATDNAEELITKLTRVMNRARQDAITTEIMEIVGGAEALRAGAEGPSDYLVDRVGADDYFTDRQPERSET